MAHLDKALKFCKKAKKLLALEKKKDYAVLTKVKKKVMAKFTIGGPPKDQDKEDTSAANVDVGSTADDAIKAKEDAMNAKVAVMCTQMKQKAETIHVYKPWMRKIAVEKAVRFCKKAKKLLAKQLSMDSAAKDQFSTKAITKQAALRSHMAKVDHALAGMI